MPDKDANGFGIGVVGVRDLQSFLHVHGSYRVLHTLKLAFPCYERAVIQRCFLFMYYVLVVHIRDITLHWQFETPPPKKKKKKKGGKKRRKSSNAPLIGSDKRAVIVQSGQPVWVWCFRSCCLVHRSLDGEQLWECKSLCGFCWPAYYRERWWHSLSTPLTRCNTHMGGSLSKFPMVGYHGCWN